MAEIVQDPQLRYTSDNQMPIAEMLVQFAGLREEDPPETLKVVGWGNLAQEIQERYHQGDRIVIEGRLGMNTIERQDGLKEKRAELTAQRIHPIGAGDGLLPPLSTTPMPTSTPMAQPAMSAPPPARTAASPAPSRRSAQPTPVPAAPPEPDAVDYDDIPF